MESIVNEELLSFKEMEQKIYQYVCFLGRELTRIILERYDKELMEGRDPGLYRNKGTRQTSITTLYGTVEYSRHVYQAIQEDGLRVCIYLLDEAMKMDKIGMISTNLAEKIAMTITEATYRTTAETISSTCGQCISHTGVWNLIQKIGERINEEEEASVMRMRSDHTSGEKIIPVLFEEMDGVWLHMQGPDHKKRPKQEMKVCTTYEGWDEQFEKIKRSKLVGKRMLAGMEDSKSFHEKREAMIRDIYDADEIKQRILNGDGGSWIKDEYDPDTIFQLDRFHIHKEIKRLIGDVEAQQRIWELFEQEKIDEMLKYILIYADSVDRDDDKGKAKDNTLKLYSYLINNKDGLLPYDKRGIPIPAPQEGMLHKSMGVQENQNCTLITMRMKHRRMRWGKGANNLAKVMCRKENKELVETIDRYSDGLVTTMYLTAIVESLSAGKSPKYDGKGNNPYPDIFGAHMPMIEAMQTASRKAFIRAFT